MPGNRQFAHTMSPKAFVLASPFSKELVTGLIEEALLSSFTDSWRLLQVKSPEPRIACTTAVPETWAQWAEEGGSRDIRKD